MAAAVQKITIIADDQTAAAIASAVRNTQKLDNQIKKTGNNMRGMTRQGRAQMAQLGHQMQDIAVQFQMGMNPLMIIGQQGSQIASVFGTGGPVIGAFIAVAAVIASIFVPSLFKAQESLDKLIETADSLDIPFESLAPYLYGKAVAEAGKEVEDLTNKAAELGNTRIQAENKLAEATAKAAAAQDKVNKALAEGSNAGENALAFAQLVQESSALNIELGLYRTRLDEAAEAHERNTIELAKSAKAFDVLTNRTIKQDKSTKKVTVDNYELASSLGVLGKEFTYLLESARLDELDFALSEAFEKGRINIDLYQQGIHKIINMRDNLIKKPVSIPISDTITSFGVAELTKEQIAYNKAMNDFVKDVTERSKPAMQKYLDEVIKVNQAVEEFGLDSQVAKEYLDKLKMSLGLTKEKVDQLASSFEANREIALLSFKDIEDNGIRSVEDAMVNLVNGTKSVKEAFSDMARSIVNDLIRMQIQKTITQPIFSFLNPAPAYDLNNGTITPVQKRAMGGPVSAGKPYLVGEKGPELMIPNGSGTIIPNHNMGGGVTINLNVSTGVSQTVRAELNSMLPQIAEISKAAVYEARRRGGTFAGAFGG